MVQSTGPGIVLLRLLFLHLLVYTCAAQGLGFQCSSTPKCQGLAGYVASNATTYETIRSLFQVGSLYDLYGANGISAPTPASTRVPANTTVRIPFPCACADGAGISDRQPVYTVKSGDTLDMIGRAIFGGLVTFQQIAAANKIANPSLIQLGQKLWIPLPCSCNESDGAGAVHLAHVVEQGSTVAGIAHKFGAAEATLLRVNNMSDPRSLLAGQVLDVPLRACNSSIGSDSPDHSLRVPNGSYALTAENCVTCSCNFRFSGQLLCEMTPDYSNMTKRLGCGRMTCHAPGNPTTEVPLGTLLVTGCASTRCDYTGYDSPINGVISTTAVVNRSMCGSAAHSLRPGPPLRWAQLLLVLFQTAPLLLAYM